MFQNYVSHLYSYSKAILWLFRGTNWYQMPEQDWELKDNGLMAQTYFTRINTSYYSCGLSTATIEYSCPSVCVSVRLPWCGGVCLSVCVLDNSKNNGTIHLKLKHIVVYGNCSDEFDIGHCPIKVKVTAS